MNRMIAFSILSIVTLTVLVGCNSDVDRWPFLCAWECERHKEATCQGTYPLQEHGGSG